MYLRSIARTHVQGEVNAADIEKAVKSKFGIDLTGKLDLVRRCGGLNAAGCTY